MLVSHGLPKLVIILIGLIVFCHADPTSTEAGTPVTAAPVTPTPAKAVRPKSNHGNDYDGGRNDVHDGYDPNRPDLNGGDRRDDDPNRFNHGSRIQGDPDAPIPVKGNFTNGRKCVDGRHGLTGRQIDLINEAARLRGVAWTQQLQRELDAKANRLHTNCKSKRCVGYFHKGSQLLCRSATFKPMYILISFLFLLRLSLNKLW